MGEFRRAALITCFLVAQFQKSVGGVEVSRMSSYDGEDILASSLREDFMEDILEPLEEEIEEKHDRISVTVSLETTMKVISAEEVEQRRQHLLQHLTEVNASGALPVLDIDAQKKIDSLTFNMYGMAFEATMELISPCTDVPPNIYTNCKNLSKGLCMLPAFKDGNFCLKSCGRCCGDIEYLGPCGVLQEMGLCGAPEVKAGKFCERSCGGCAGAVLPPPPSRFMLPTPPPPPPISLQTGCGAWSAIGCDAQALMEFHDRMNPTAQAYLSSWSWGTDPCTRNWKGVSCKQLSGVKRVSEVTLSYVFMQTSIPPMLSLITYLNTLDLDQCNLVGTLPPQLSALNNLKQLDLWKNQLTGTLPVEYSTWKAATEVHFSYNKFEGEVPQQYSELLPLGYFYVEPQDRSGLCISPTLLDHVINQTSHTNALALPTCK